MNELKGGQLESTLLEPADDLADESTLDAVRLDEHTLVSIATMDSLLWVAYLDHDVGALVNRHYD